MLKMSDNKSYGATGEEPPAYYPDAGVHNGQTTLDTNTPPPTYTQSQNEAPPPTYESIMGELRAAHQNAEGRGHFVKSVCRILWDTTGFTISVCLLLAIPVLMITVGALNLENCQVEVLIPIWLIVSGSIMSIMQLMSVYQRLKKKCKSSDVEAQPEEPSQAYNMFTGVMGCFNVAWFFAGNVWVYRIYRPNTTDVNDDDYCDHTTYYLSFWLITIVYIVILCFCCCSCCLASCAAGGASSNNENDS